MRLVYLTEDHVINIDKIVSIQEFKVGGQPQTRVYLGGGTDGSSVQVKKSLSEVMDIIEERMNRTVTVTRQGVTYDAAV